MTASLSDRIHIANAGIELARSQLGAIPQFAGSPPSLLRCSSYASAGSGYLDAAKFYGVMAEYDIATNGTQYEDDLEQLFAQALSGHTNFSNSE